MNWDRLTAALLWHPHCYRGLGSLYDVVVVPHDDVVHELRVVGDMLRSSLNSPALVDVSLGRDDEDVMEALDGMSEIEKANRKEDQLIVRRAFLGHDLHEVYSIRGFCWRQIETWWINCVRLAALM